MNIGLQKNNNKKTLCMCMCKQNYIFWENYPKLYKYSLNPDFVKCYFLTKDKTNRQNETKVWPKYVAKNTNTV